MEVLIDLKPISEQVLILDNLLLLNAADVTKLPNLKRFDSLGIMLLICAAVPIVVAGYSMIAALMFVNRAERAEGLIVELKTEAPWPGKGISTFPLIEFADSSGLKHRAELRSYSFPITSAVGSHLKVMYDPISPQDVRIDSWRARWFQPLLGLSFGFLLFGAAFFIGRKPNSSRISAVGEGSAFRLLDKMKKSQRNAA